MPTFDTLKASEDLQASGILPEQAKAVIRAIEASRSVDLSHLVTLVEFKSEFAAVRAEMRTEFAAVRGEAQIADRDLKLWTFRTVAGATGIIVSVLVAGFGFIARLLPHS